jgi:hypothetical protein
MMLMYRQNHTKITREKKSFVYDTRMEHYLENKHIGIRYLIYSESWLIALVLLKLPLTPLQH